MNNANNKEISNQKELYKVFDRKFSNLKQPITNSEGEEISHSISMGDDNMCLSQFGKEKGTNEYAYKVILQNGSNRTEDSTICFCPDHKIVYGNNANSSLKLNPETSLIHPLTTSRLIYKINETEKEILNILFNKDYPENELTIEQLEFYENILYNAKEKIKIEIKDIDNLIKKDFPLYLKQLKLKIKEENPTTQIQLDNNNNINNDSNNNDVNENKINKQDNLKELIETKSKTIEELINTRNSLYAYDGDGNKIQITPEEANFLHIHNFLKSDFFKEHNIHFSNEMAYTVPDYMSDQEIEYKKQILKDILGKEINIYRESEAAVMYYYHTKYNEIFKSGKKTHNVLLVDIGESKTSLVYAEMTPDSYKTIDRVTSLDIGSKQMCDVIYEYCIKKFKDENNLNNIKITDKMKFRLLQEIKKKIKNLSSNEAIDIKVYNFLGTNDIDITLSENDFKGLINNIIIKYHNLINKIKNRNNGFNKIDNIEINGEVSRTPLFQKELQSDLPKELIEKLKNDNINKKMALTTILVDENHSAGGAILQAAHTKSFPTPLQKMYSLKSTGKIIDKDLLNNEHIKFPKLETVKTFIKTQNEKYKQYDIFTTYKLDIQKQLHKIDKINNNTIKEKCFNINMIINGFEYIHNKSGTSNTEMNELKKQLLDFVKEIMAKRIKEIDDQIDKIKNQQDQSKSKELLEELETEKEQILNVEDVDGDFSAMRPSDNLTKEIIGKLQEIHETLESNANKYSLPKKPKKIPLNNDNKNYFSSLKELEDKLKSNKNNKDDLYSELTSASAVKSSKFKNSQQLIMKDVDSDNSKYSKEFKSYVKKNEKDMQKSLSLLISIMFPDNSFKEDENININKNNIYIGINIAESINEKDGTLKNNNNFSGVHIQPNGNVYYYLNGEINGRWWRGLGFQRFLTQLKGMSELISEDKQNNNNNSNYSNIINNLSNSNIQNNSLNKSNISNNSNNSQLIKTLRKTLNSPKNATRLKKKQIDQTWANNILRILGNIKSDKASSGCCGGRVF